MPATTVFYHADCLDGFGAAYAAWRRFGNAARYRALHHGEGWQLEDVRGRQVYILDFSFTPAALAAMAAAAVFVLQLDHHATARDMWAAELPASARGMPAGLARHRHAQLPLEVAFDLDKSGARLAWEHFHPDAPVPLPIRHIEDQDLWRFALPGTRAFCRALRLLPFDFTAWDALMRDCADGEAAGRYRELCAQGEAIDRFLGMEVERLAQSGQVMPACLAGEAVDPHRASQTSLPLCHLADGTPCHAIFGLAINANMLFASELGHHLARQSGTFGLIWQMDGRTADGRARIKASLRGDGRLNVAHLAERLGGGGHPNAAGFRLDLERFTADILGLPRGA
jgi:hypothetical protein